jgi:hypothetical protein
MTKLSPAALAVRDAAEKQTDLDFRYAPMIAAAALRAAADQTKQVIARAPVYGDWSEGWKDGATAITEHLLAIAAELKQAANINTTEAPS